MVKYFDYMLFVSLLFFSVKFPCQLLFLCHNLCMLTICLFYHFMEEKKQNYGVFFLKNLFSCGKGKNHCKYIYLLVFVVTHICICLVLFFSRHNTIYHFALLLFFKSKYLVGDGVFFSFSFWGVYFNILCNKGMARLSMKLLYIYLIYYMCFSCLS